MTNGIVRAAAALAAVGLAASAQAETVKLTAVGAPPPVVLNVKLLKEFFIPEINRRLAASGKDYRIEWREAWAQSLAKFTETFEAVEEGIAHVGLIIHLFEESKLPLEQYTYMVPFGTEDPYKLQAIDEDLHRKIPEINASYVQHNQVYLGGGVADGWHLLTKFPVRQVADLNGKKIGMSGATGHWLRGTGAVIVTSSMQDAYTSIRNGVYDGYISTVSLAFPYKIHEPAPHFTRVNFGTTTGSGLSVNKKTWDGFPAHVKEIFAAVAKEWCDRFTKESDERAKSLVAAMQGQGAQFAPFPAEERRKWAFALPNVPKQWAQDLDKRGLPGTRLLAGYMDGLRGAGVEVVRHWDRE